MGIVLVARLADENIDIETNQLDSQCGEPVVIFLSPSELNDDCLAIHVPKVAKSRQESLDGGMGCRAWAKKSNSGNSGWFLRAHPLRPIDHRTSNERDELPSFHSITSLARATIHHHRVFLHLA